jgi:hypothetical protein
MGGPVNVAATIKNAGNVCYLNKHLTAVSGSAKLPFNGVLVLGGSTRSETAPPMFGFPAHLAAQQWQGSGYGVSVHRARDPHGGVLAYDQPPQVSAQPSTVRCVSRTRRVRLAASPTLPMNRRRPAHARGRADTSGRTRPCRPVRRSCNK